MTRHPVISSRHEGGDDLTNQVPPRSILDVPGTIPLRGTDIDHRIELEPRLSLAAVEPQMSARSGTRDEYSVGRVETASRSTSRLAGSERPRDVRSTICHSVAAVLSLGHCSPRWS